MCRQQLTLRDMITVPPPQDDTADLNDDDSEFGGDDESTAVSRKPFTPSSKIKALLEFLQASVQRDATVKSIVFSQWTSMLALVAEALRRAGIQFVQIDGTMNRQRRERAMAQFQSDGGPVILLASLGVASLGLNLTRGSQVFFMGALTFLPLYNCRSLVESVG